VDHQPIWLRQIQSIAPGGFPAVLPELNRLVNRLSQFLKPPGPIRQAAGSNQGAPAV